MKKFLIAAIAIACMIGWSGIVTAAQKEKASPEDQFKKMDTDGDGKLTLQEFVGKRKDDAATKAETRFKRLDKDGDGSLTLEEFKAGSKKKKDE